MVVTNIYNIKNMITGKTISQLDLLSNITDDTSMPVELSGNTYHVQYSAITNNLIEQGFNNGIKLLSKQQINLNEPLIPTGIVSILFCLTESQFCRFPNFQVGETIVNEFGVTGEIILNYENFQGYYIDVTNVSGGSFNVGENITGLTSNFSSSIYELNNGSESLQPITLTGGTNFIIQSSFITNPSSPTFNANGGIVNNTGDTLTLQCYNMANNLTTPNSYILSNCGGAVEIGTIFYTSSNQVYLLLSTIEGSDVTADLYIYGYILN